MKHGIIRKVAAVALTAAVGATLAGCASGGGGSAGGEENLDFWIFLDPNSPDDPRGAALKSIVDDYNAQSDGVTVTVRSINYAKIDAEVIKATASGQGPDIINIYSNQLPTHVAAGTIQPMTEYAQPLLDELGDDYLFPIDGATFDGDIMALPWEIRAWLLWYRADLLADAGLEVPQTLDELGTTAAALGAATGTTGLGVGFSNQGLGADFMEKFIPFTWGNGGDVLVNGEPAFASDAGVATMDYFTQLHDEGAFGDEVLSMGADEVINGIKAGTISMAIEGSYRVAAARSGEGIGDNLQTAPIPSDVAGTPLQTPVAGQTLAIGANAEDPAAAWDFIQYYASAVSQEKFAAAGVLPVLASVYDSEAVQTLPNAGELATWRDYVLDYGRPAPVSENFSELSDALVTAGQRVVFQGADAASELDAVAGQFGG
ncbi:MAG: extracellular solute-binding protein [Actinomycetales bacterium]|nr:extracellular solute-binding protein [Actinomycetales bacterium]